MSRFLARKSSWYWWLFGAGVFGWLGLATGARAEDNTKNAADNAVVQLDAFEVTGSRVKRLDADGPQPVARFTADDIETRGFDLLGDFLQSLPFNTAGSASVLQMEKAYRGLTAIDPRGLGSGRFLVLIDGRRAAPFALNDAGRSYFDFNSVPLAAIERVEYEKDGASAIYGSDAMTGVMNIKLKRDYRGITTSLMLGNTLGHDTFTRSADVLVGTGDPRKTSLLVDVSWFKQNANFIRDYNRSKTTDYSYLGPVKGSNQNSTANYPANVTLSAAQATAAGLSTGAGYYVVQGGQPTANPTTALFTRYASSSLTPNENRYDFARAYQLYPERENRSAFARLRHDLTDRLTVFAQFVYSDNVTDYTWTPAVANSSSVVTSAGTTLKIPATNPYNPFGVDITTFNYRTNFGPPRLFDETSKTANLQTGIQGRLGGDWTWESGVDSGRNTVKVVSRNQIKADDLQAALNGTTRNTALNPFGPSDNQTLVNSLFVASNNDAKTTVLSGDLSATGSLFAMPGFFGQPSAGAAKVAMGSEWREERIESRPDTTAYVGTGGGQPFAGAHTVWSAFLELVVPVLRQGLEFQLAGRHERFSDFGDATNPKFGFLAQPLRWLKLRGSFSRSFKAPDLGFLNSTRTISYTPAVYSDPLRPQDGARQLKIITGGNPALQPEKGKIWYGGAVFDLGKITRGLSFSADWFNFKIDRAIVTYTTPAYLFAYFPDRVVRDNSQGTPGPISYLEATPNNVAAYYYRGFDFGLDYRLNRTSWGDFNFGVQTTRIDYYGYDAGFGAGPVNFAGRYNQPRWTGNAQANWKYRRFGAGISAVYKGPYFNDNATYSTIGWGENPIAKINAYLACRGYRDIEIRLGVDNVFNTPPPSNGKETTSFDESTYAAWSLGRFVYVSLKKEY
jgi:outer membrane receptor protein involved in Fe transport